MSDPQTERGDLHLYCFHKSGLTKAQWEGHVEGLVPHMKELDLATSFRPTMIESLDTATQSSRVAVIRLRNLRRHDLAACSAIIESASIAAFEQETGVEYVLLPSQFRDFATRPGLAVFDMDSTLIQQEVIDELARAVGKYDQVSAITEAAMRGEAPYTDFTASLRARVGLLNGVPTSIWDDLRKSTITFTPGAKDLVKVLKAAGWKTAVLSGGFIPLANWVKDTLGLDYAYANHLVEKDGFLTGELVPGQPIIHAEQKRVLLEKIAKDEGISRTIAVGDGSNDLKMMAVADLGIAFNAKPKVQAAAPVRLNSESLLDVLYILGFDQERIDEVLR